MRILWVKAGGLVPPDTGGKIRSYQILRQLASRHEVTVSTFYAAFDGDPHTEQLRKDGLIPDAIPMAIASGRGLGEMARYARLQLDPLPYSIVKYYSREVRARVNARVSSGRFDLIVCDFLVPGGLMPWRGKPPVVLFTHNVETEIWKRQAEVAASPLWRWVFEREAEKMARAERGFVAAAGQVLTVSDRDSAVFRRFTDAAKVITIPTGVDTEYFQPAPGREKQGVVVFTGSMDWLPNEDAVLYAAAEVLPTLFEARGEATFWIVGRRPTERIAALASDRIHVTGAVPDIRPYLDDAAVYAVPMRSGSGTRLKIFEAMAAGKAIVSTTTGAEGLPVTSGENIVLEDDPREFARAVARLLGDPEERGRLGSAARTLVETHYGWPSVGRFFEQCLDRAVRHG